jgi:hypothetical protein
VRAASSIACSDDASVQPPRPLGLLHVAPPPSSTQKPARRAKCAQPSGPGDWKDERKEGALAMASDLTLREACAITAKEPGTVVTVAITNLRNLAPWRVCGDGRCLWYSVVAADALSRGLSAEELHALDSQGEIVRGARKLRLRVCDYLRDPATRGLKSEFAPFWARGEEGTAGARSEEEYLRGLKRGRVFGGHLELHAAAEILGRVLVVIDLPPNADDPWARVCAHRRRDVDPGSSPLLLLRSQLHYDAASLCASSGAASRSLSPRRSHHPNVSRRRAVSSSRPERSRLDASPRVAGRC